MDYHRHAQKYITITILHLLYHKNLLFLKCIYITEKTSKKQLYKSEESDNYTKGVVNRLRA